MSVTAGPASARAGVAPAAIAAPTTTAAIIFRELGKLGLIAPLRPGSADLPRPFYSDGKTISSRPLTSVNKWEDCTGRPAGKPGRMGRFQLSNKACGRHHRRLVLREWCAPVLRR